MQLKELEEEWGKLPGTRPPPLASFAPSSNSSKQSRGGLQLRGVADQDEEGEVAAVPEAVDPYDFADPEDFLGKMPKDFFERVVRVGCWLHLPLNFKHDLLNT